MYSRSQEFFQVAIRRTIRYREDEPRPKERRMIWKELRSPSKFGFELPGPEGPGFLLPDEWIKNFYDGSID